MAEPRSGKRDGKNNETDHDLIKQMIGTPDPSLQYVADTATRLWRAGWVVIVVVLVLYFMYGP